MITAYSILFSVPNLNDNNVAFHLNKCKFPAAKWIQLAIGLRQADAVFDIETNKGEYTAYLGALIRHWVHNDLHKTWEKLVDAVVITKERAIAIQLANDVGVPPPGKNNN